MAVRPEGVVYAARDASGRAVSVAMLSSGAAGDAAARDRFSAAVLEGAGVSRAPQVLASGVSASSAAWVAVASGGRGAEVFLEPVAVASRPGAGGPGYVPYWASSTSTGTSRWSWPRGSGAALAGAGSGGSNRGLVAGVVALLALVVALLLVLYFFLSGLSRQAYSTPSESPSGPGASPSAGVSPSPSPSGGSGGSSPPASPSGRDGSGEPSPEGSRSPSAPVPSVSLDEDDYGEFPVDPGNPEDLV
ncbi:hypothetical protein [Actinorugispora endophytica]|uniref:hypothetical protein n=1 Tax=Actinorugispora endophytica TaxID=1605990 RepID=UPI001414E317|nr:hypothetical protein [Actinorugispora endophytica]